MKSFALLLVCFQACFVQNVFSQCLGTGPYGYGPGILANGPCTGPYGPEVIAPGIAPLAGLIGPGPYAGYGLGAELIAPGLTAAYGGAGIGDVAVVGEMPVAGTTLVAGQVPILGAVRFAGDLPAAGTVTITGSCGCGCNRGPYYY
ncbi:chorion class CA protein ERA.1-like [Maniola jurtina]|uniref:chorion class CA protein ERA.1-like n=1 Tax=Maniola jurtina TaxID=191418 RepID=UPI001E686259|nr:chorion class CA protein ERA.1-like [Maniola jurtina]